MIITSKVPLPVKNQQANPLSARFSGAGPNASAQAKPDFGRKLLNYLDFKELNNSHVNQIQVIYLACIAWRLLAANERRKASETKSWNEIRESAVRDAVGFSFWFFATPLLQRGYLKWVGWKYPELKNSLIQKIVVPKNLNNSGKSLQPLKFINPLTSLHIPSSEQVKDWKEKAFLDLTSQGIKPNETAYIQTEKFYKQLLMHRNIATAWGLGATIALLGIGINLLNIHMTRKSTQHREAAMKRPSFPSPPPLPKMNFQPSGFANPAIPSDASKSGSLPVNNRSNHSLPVAFTGYSPSR